MSMGCIARAPVVNAQKRSTLGSLTIEMSANETLTAYLETAQTVYLHSINSNLTSIL